MYFFGKIVLTFFLVWLVNSPFYAQDASYAVFNYNKLKLNTAFTGLNPNAELQMYYRNQWPGVQGGYTNYSASVQNKSKWLHGALGFVISKDVQGGNTFTETDIMLIYNYQFQLSKNIKSAFSIAPVYRQYMLNTANLILPDRIHPLYGIQSSGVEILKGYKMNILHFSTGYVVYTKRLAAGLALFNVGMLNFSDLAYTNPLRIHGHVSGSFLVNSLQMINVSPQLVVIKQGGFLMLNYGIQTSKYPMLAGVRLQQNLLPQMQFTGLVILTAIQTEKVSIGYSLTLHGAKTFVPFLGAHEIMLKFSGGLNNNNKNQISCPAF